MKGSLWSGAGWLLKFTLTVAVTYFLFRSLRLSWDEIAKLDVARWRPQPLVIILSFVLLLVVFAYVVGLWAQMVRSFGGPRIGSADAFRIFFIANLGRYIPGKLWQLAGLAYLASRHGVSPPVASSAAVIGQIYSLAAAAVIAAAGLALAGGNAVPAGVAPIALALAAGLVVVIVLPQVLQPILRIAGKIGRSEDLLSSLIGPGFGLRWLGLYVPAWVGYGVAFGLLWGAFPALSAVSWPAAVGSFAGAYFLGYAAVFAPAGVGVREGALALLLAPWIGGANAAVLAVAARLWMTVAELVPVAVIGVASGLTRVRGGR